MSNFGKTLLTATLGGCISLGAFKAFENDKKVVIEKVPANYSRIANYTSAGANGTLQVDFSYAAEKVTPAVVHIRSTMRAARPGQMQEIPAPFRDFFGEEFSHPDGAPQPAQATGSGVIVNENGYIVTNNHVIDGAQEVEVTLYDKRSYKAKIIGTDPSTDLALLQINGKDLPKLSLGNSDDVKVGQWVLAVGNPFNLSSTVTAGIVSAKGRSINILRDKTPVESFIQTDAAVNPGNSGGALVNLNGELVGINTAIASQTGSYAGYAFAVPTSIVSKVVSDLIEYGKVQRAFLGISIRDLDSKLATEKGLNLYEGVWVEGLSATGAAKAAGLKEGDVIVKVDGKAVRSVPQLQEYISVHKPGDVVKVVVNRQGKENTLSIPLKNMEGNTEIVRNTSSESIEALGASFENLSDVEKSKLNTKGGVKVSKLNPGKLSSETEIQEGFIITKVNHLAVNNVKELQSILQKSEGGGVLIEGFYPGDTKPTFYAFGL